jgi:hypothetical protein
LTGEEALFRRANLLRLIEPGKPNQNAYIESFNERQRDECLNEHWFTSLACLSSQPPEKPLGSRTDLGYCAPLSRKFSGSSA